MQCFLSSPMKCCHLVVFLVLPDIHIPACSLLQAFCSSSRVFPSSPGIFTSYSTGNHFLHISKHHLSDVLAPSPRSFFFRVLNPVCQENVPILINSLLCNFMFQPLDTYSHYIPNNGRCKWDSEYTGIRTV